MRKSFIGAGLAVGLVLATALSVFGADSMPASKATAQTLGFQVMELAGQNGSPAAETGWVTIFNTNLKTANQKDLFIDASFQTGLYTYTLVKSKGMVWDVSKATAGIKVRVLVDGVEASPGVVVFDKRTQELSARLQGEIDLVDQNGDGYISEDELAIVDYEEISLMLDTTAAHSFNFVLDDLSSGVHNIQVQAQMAVENLAGNGTAESRALIGKGSVTVEEVRMVRGTPIELE